MKEEQNATEQYPTDRHGLYRPPISSSCIPTEYYQASPHVIFYPPTYTHQEDQRRLSHDWYAPFAPTFAPAYHDERDRECFSPYWDQDGYHPYHYLDYQYLPHPYPQQSYHPYHVQQSPLSVHSVPGDNNSYSALCAAAGPSFVRHHQHSDNQHTEQYKLLPNYFSKQILSEPRSDETCPSRVIPKVQDHESEYHHKGTRHPHSKASYSTKPVKFPGMTTRPENTFPVMQEPTTSQTPKEEPERKSTVASKNPYLTLTREKWQEKIRRPPSPMSQEDRDAWYQNILYALDAYVFPFPGPPYKCPICEREERRRFEIVGHIRSHIPEARKIFVCNICKKSFSRSNYLKDHMFRHSQFGNASESEVQVNNQKAEPEETADSQEKKHQVESRPLKRKFSLTEIATIGEQSTVDKNQTTSFKI